MFKYQFIIATKDGEHQVFNLAPGMTFTNIYQTGMDSDTLKSIYLEQKQFDGVLSISSSPETENAFENYQDFIEFCKANFLNNKENITNFILKDNDGNVYYNISKEDLMYVDMEGSTRHTPDGTLTFNLVIFYKEN